MWRLKVSCSTRHVNTHVLATKLIFCYNSNYNGGSGFLYVIPAVLYILTVCSIRTVCAISFEIALLKRLCTEGVTSNMTIFCSIYTNF